MPDRFVFLPTGHLSQTGLALFDNPLHRRRSTPRLAVVEDGGRKVVKEASFSAPELRTLAFWLLSYADDIAADRLFGATDGMFPDNEDFCGGVLPRQCPQCQHVHHPAAECPMCGLSILATAPNPTRRAMAG